MASTRHGKPLLMLLVGSLQLFPQTIQTIIITLHCLPELEGKDHIAGYTTGLQGTKLELTWKPLYEGLALILTEGTMLTCQGYRTSNSAAQLMEPINHSNEWPRKMSPMLQ